jgi:hypothetical protein
MYNKASLLEIAHVVTITMNDYLFLLIRWEVGAS